MPRQKRTELLTKVVEAEILPRLASMTNMAGNRSAGATEAATTTVDTTELVRLLLGREDTSASLFIATLRQRGLTPCALYLGIITQAARVLGELWDDDRCDFTQVTVGLGRLQQIVRGISPGFQAAAVYHPHPETVLLVPAPGEQHTFGLLIVSEFFQREGWHVAGGPATAAEEATDIVRENWVDVAGFSIAAEARLPGLTDIIRSLRQASRNRDLSIMIGGPLLLLRPDLVAHVGADMGARDALTAVRQASGLVALRTAAD
jgi:methanogenic corrinoid protein MtbC1